MRSIALLTALLPIAAAAQSWAPIGAKWTYKQGSCCGPDTNLAVIEVIGDTLIAGRTCSEVVMTTGWAACYEHVRFHHESNDSLFFWNEHDEQFELLFRWDALPGDSWYTHIGDLANQTEPVDTLDWTVIDTGHVVIGGMVLRTWSVEVFSRSWLYATPIGQVTERLGPGWSPFTWVSGVCDAESFMQLRCYEDSDISWQNPQIPQCALTTGIGEQAGTGPLTIAPNPVTAGEACTITFAGPRHPDDRLMVRDALGRVMLHISVQDEPTVLRIPASGAYTVSLHRNGVPIAHRHIVVQ